MEIAAAHRDEHGVDPICATLRGKAAQIAPSMVRAHLIPQRTESARVVRDREVLAEIRKIHADNLGVYGARKGALKSETKGNVGGPVHRGTIDESRWVTGNTTAEGSEDHAQ